MTEVALNAADPTLNATVRASAGTGKTWLLVTRIIRLLLSGCKPDSILALTFTRKAAAEMQQRLTERLYSLMSADDPALDKILAGIGVTPGATVRLKARALYEQVLFSPFPLRTTTFHAFCQDLLQNFPMEAGIPPGFEICESTVQLEQEAWEALVSQVSTSPDTDLAHALESLVDDCSGTFNANLALMSFIGHRSDWWAFTSNAKNPARYAAAFLERQMGTKLTENPLAGFPDDMQRQQLLEFVQFLQQKKTRTDTVQAGRLASLLEVSSAFNFEELWLLFFTRAGKPRARKSNNTQRKRLGDVGEDRFLELHEIFVKQLEDMRDRLAQQKTLRASLNWFTIGVELLAHFQRIKREQRLLDFADIEWQACELLNRSEHTDWVQYKLDCRIDHLLVDEFQDTNPTQWRLLQPLLEEFARTTQYKTRSIFMVGDEKQSIYGFRRANPELFDTAASWLESEMQAKHFPLNKSRRSASAIIDCVNAVFKTEPLQLCMGSFEDHQTYDGDLYGHVGLLSLFTDEKTEQETTSELRNPLLAPRIIHENIAHYHEGMAIADRIRALVDAKTLVTVDNIVRPLRYHDVIILLRARTHAPAYEHALRDKSIPFIGAERGSLLANIEVQDLEALLRVLVSPTDNLTLAQVLRCPLFDVSDDDLMQIAAMKPDSWFHALQSFSEKDNPVLATAGQMLESWRKLTGHVPVHDLLDRIFHEGDVISRYTAAFPAELSPRVCANLCRFIELALEVDSGRYPSVPHFLARLEQLRLAGKDQPDEETPDEAGLDCVRVMTIHAAKGLEAPVVFLADTASKTASDKAYQACVDWPSGKHRPTNFFLKPRKQDQDKSVQSLLETKYRIDRREKANLLYVAMTRAKQMLYISGAGNPDKIKDTWYDLINHGLTPFHTDKAGLVAEHTTGNRQEITCEPKPAQRAVTPDKGLTNSIDVANTIVQIAPSHTVDHFTINTLPPREHGNNDATDRGSAIHYLLEKLTIQPNYGFEQAVAYLSCALDSAPDEKQLRGWWNEATSLLGKAELSGIFNADHFDRALNEQAVQYLDGDCLVYGIIDRLVITRGRIDIIDYKTHWQATTQTIPEIAENYRQQMQLYAEAVRRLWPDRAVKAALLFTRPGVLHQVELT